MVGNVESRQKSRPFKKLVVTDLQEARLLQGSDKLVEPDEILLRTLIKLWKFHKVGRRFLIELES